MLVVLRELAPFSIRAALLLLLVAFMLRLLTGTLALSRHDRQQLRAYLQAARNRRYRRRSNQINQDGEAHDPGAQKDEWIIRASRWLAGLALVCLIFYILGIISGPV